LFSANNLASLLIDRGQMLEAERLLKHYEPLARRILGEEEEATLTLRHNRASVWNVLGRPVEAEKVLNEVLALRLRVLGPENEQTLASQHLRGVALLNAGRTTEGRRVLEDALSKFDKVFGAEHPGTLFCKHNLANFLLGLGAHARADLLIREVIASRKKVLGAKHRDTLASQTLLVALSAFRKSGYPEAERLGQECLPVAERELGPRHPTTINFLQNLSSIYLQQSKYPEALRLAWRLLEAGRDDDARTIVGMVLTLRARADRPDPAVDLQVRLLSAWTEHRAGQTALAEQQLRACHAQGRQRLTPGHWLVGLVGVLLGECLAAQKKYADAEPLALSGYEALRKATGVPQEQLREAHARVVALDEAWGRPDAARRWRNQPPRAKP
jgi:tetratricopeptide (TPR) repeat protein